MITFRNRMRFFIVIILQAYFTNVYARKSISRNSIYLEKYKNTTKFQIGDSKMIRRIIQNVFQENSQVEDGKDAVEMYSPEVIPVMDNQPLQVNIGIHLIELAKFDTLNEELTVLLEILLKWTDHRISWNPDGYGGVKVIDLPFNSVWVPQIGVFNALDGVSRFTSEDNTNKVQVFYDGRIQWEQMSSKIIKCPLAMDYFPFDLQVCLIDLWTLSDHNRISLKLDNVKDFFPAKSIVNVWSVFDTTLFNHGQEHVTYALILKRKAAFYVTDIILPCTLIALLSLFSLFIEAGHESRLQVNLTVIIAISVNQLLASQNLPISDTLTTLTIFLIIQYSLVYLALLTSLILWGIKSQLESRPLNFRPNTLAFKIIVDYTLGILVLTKFHKKYHKRSRILEEIWKIAAKKLKIIEKNRFEKNFVDPVNHWKKVAGLHKNITTVTERINKVSNPEQNFEKNFEQNHHLPEVVLAIKKAHEQVDRENFDVDTSSSCGRETPDSVLDDKNNKNTCKNVDEDQPGAKTFTIHCPESKLARLEWNLIFISVDRFFAVLYIIVLFSCLAWVLKMKDDKIQIDELLEDIEDLKSGQKELFSSLVDGSDVY